MKGPNVSSCAQMSTKSLNDIRNNLLQMTYYTFIVLLLINFYNNQIACRFPGWQLNSWLYEFSSGVLAVSGSYNPSSTSFPGFPKLHQMCDCGSRHLFESVAGKSSFRQLDEALIYEYRRATSRIISLTYFILPVVFGFNLGLWVLSLGAVSGMGSLSCHGS